MADVARRKVEILVHITAPSRGQDDASYRALTQAYLDFEPTKVHKLADDATEEDTANTANSQLQEELAYSTLNGRESEASYRPDDDPEPESIPLSNISQQNVDFRLELSQGITSPDLSFNSALDNADSPAWGESATGSPRPPSDFNGRLLQHSPGSMTESTVEIADSQPDENRILPAFSSPARILELFIQQIQSSDERSSSCSVGGKQPSLQSPELPIGIPQPQSQLSQSRTREVFSTPGVPTSPSPHKRAQKPSPSGSILCTSGPLFTQDPAISSKRQWPESSLDDNHISSLTPIQLAIKSSTVRTRTTKSRKKQRTDGYGSETIITKAVTSSKVTMVTSSAPSFESVSLWAEKSEIRPPPPETSTSDLSPAMLVTPSLKQLFEKISSKALFNPDNQKRDLRPMERGYWLVNCENWDPVVRKRCWEILGEFIEKGKGGWGIWCIQGGDLESIRLYCWGTVVEHSYLLLYVASGNKIKGTGACWIGGDGEVVIIMPS